MFAVIGRGLFYKLSKERFGDTYRAVVTLFQLITLDDWFQVFLDVDESKEFCYLFIYFIIC